MNLNEQPRVVFENEKRYSRTSSSQSKTSRIVQWIIRHSGGLIRNERQALCVVYGFVAVAAATSFIVLFGGDTRTLNTTAPVIEQGMIPGQIPGEI
jgi:hypothetical protein